MIENAADASIEDKSLPDNVKQEATDDLTCESPTEQSHTDSVKEIIVAKLKSLIDQVSKETDKATRAIKSKDQKITDHCVRLRNKVDLQSEIMHEEIRQWNEEMRNKIDEYEKECLDKFNADEFEANANLLKSLVADVNDHQKRVEQELDDATLDTKMLKELFKQTSRKLRALKSEQVFLESQQFGNEFLEFSEIGNKKFDPSRYSALTSLNIIGIDSMKKLSMIRDMPDFEGLEYCFINPRNELIAIVLTKSNQAKLVKMDKNGQVLKEKQTDMKIEVLKLQAVEDCFIIERGADEFLRFDYEFNQMEFHIEQTYCCGKISQFAASQKQMILTRGARKKKADRFDNIFYGKHDLTELNRLNTKCLVHHIEEMIANDKYLFIFNSQIKRARIVDLEHYEGDDQEASYDRQRLVDDLPFLHQFSQVKLLGDKYIATYDSIECILRIYTQDAKLDLVREHKISTIDNSNKYEMSVDCSRNICFFHYGGHIYHDMI